MADVRCDCHESCPPCTGRCPCGFQKAETGILLGSSILMVLFIVFTVFSKRFIRLWKKSDAEVRPRF